jgi:hypothetical protein
MRYLYHSTHAVTQGLGFLGPVRQSVRLRSPLNDSVCYSSEASAYEQSRAFALLNRPQGRVQDRSGYVGLGSTTILNDMLA